MTKPNPIQSPNLQVDGITHGFFTRIGGVSTGIYKGLNVGIGSDDERALVLENRKRVAQTLGVTPPSLLTVYQVHSPDVIEVNKPWEGDKRPQVDAMVTNKPEIAIGALSADCGPVLFCDGTNRVIGAAHAGWKGATSGVLENTIAAMENLGAQRSHICAVLGPTISHNAYEVGPEFVERLIDMDPSNDVYLTPSQNPSHAMFDLPSYIVKRLTNAGIQATWTGHCTYGDEELFYSYRRKTHRGEVDYGRQISAIKINTETIN